MANKNWYKINAKSDQIVITIHGQIGDWGVTAADFEWELKQHEKGSDMVIHFHTDGGSVLEGCAIHNILKRYAGKITTIVDGVAASMGSYLFMLGDERIIPENGWLMIHAPRGARFGTEEETRAFADFIGQAKEDMVKAYVSGSNLSEAEVLEMMKVDTWIRGDKAVEMGLATRLDDEVSLAAQCDLTLTGIDNVPDEVLQIYAKNSSKESKSDKESKPLSAVADTNQKKEAPMPKKAETATPQVGETLDAKKENSKGPDLTLEALAREKSRKAEIVAAFGDFKNEHQDLMTECLLDDTVTVSDAQAKLLKAMGENVKPHSGVVTAGKTGSERFIDDAVESLTARAGQGQVTSSNPLRQMRLDMIARKSLELAGTRADGMTPLELVGAAFTNSSSDFPVLLENTMYKVLQNAYSTQSDTWSRFCSVGSVSDFRAHNRYRVGSFGKLDSLTESGEYRNKAIPDGEKSSISVGTKGNIINLTREAIINDDLGALVNFAAQLGRAARRTIEADVYALLALNGGLGPTLADGNTLFHSDHNNIGAGAAISVSALEAERVLMAQQKDISGNDYLDLSPSVLLVPTAIGGTARVINSAQYDPDTSGKLQRPNMVNGLYSDIVDTPRLSGTRRYSFANPSEAPVIEVAFLNGEQSPFLDSQDGFTSDGVKWKVRLDYGVAAIDYRGATTDAGA